MRPWSRGPRWARRPRAPPWGPRGINCSKASQPRCLDFQLPDVTENTLLSPHWVSTANSNFKSGYKTETLNMFFAFFPTLATHLILTLRFQFPGSRRHVRAHGRPVGPWIIRTRACRALGQRSQTQVCRPAWLFFFFPVTQHTGFISFSYLKISPHKTQESLPPGLTMAQPAQPTALVLRWDRAHPRGLHGGRRDLLVIISPARPVGGGLRGDRRPRGAGFPHVSSKHPMACGPREGFPRTGEVGAGRELT